MALDFYKPGPIGVHTVQAPNGRTWVWDKSKWVLSHEAFLNFDAESPIEVGSYETVDNGVTSIGVVHYLDTNNLDDLPDADTTPVP